MIDSLHLKQNRLACLSKQKKIGQELDCTNSANIADTLEHMPVHSILKNDNRFIKNHLENQLDNERPEIRFYKSRLQARATFFQTHFPGKLSYAVKANSAECVLKTLNEFGLSHYDVASLVEMRQVHSINPDAILHYHNPIRSRTEITAAYQLYNCRRFVVDSLSEFQKLHDTLSGCDGFSPPNIQLAVRFAMPKHEDSVQDFSKKFGADLHEAEAILKLARTMDYVLGITFHVGSQCLSPEAYEKHITACHKISSRAEVELSFINVGGGFPALYQSTEYEDIKSNEDQLINFFHTIRQVKQRFFNTGVKFECEPGRALIAPAFSLLTTIKTVREENRELYLNDGIYGGLMEAYQFKDLTPIYRFIGEASENPMISCDSRCAEDEWTIYGPTCDPCDVLPLPMRLPSFIHEGDKIEFLGVGAYSLATSTRFNGYGDLKLIECE